MLHACAGEAALKCRTIRAREPGSWYLNHGPLNQRLIRARFGCCYMLPVHVIRAWVRFGQSVMSCTVILPWAFCI